LLSRAELQVHHRLQPIGFIVIGICYGRLCRYWWENWRCWSPY
jgi:hypothetical protein